MGVLMIAAFLGASRAIFMAALVFVMMGILFVAPYFSAHTIYVYW